MYDKFLDCSKPYKLKMGNKASPVQCTQCTFIRFILVTVAWEKRAARKLAKDPLKSGETFLEIPRSPGIHLIHQVLHIHVTNIHSFTLCLSVVCFSVCLSIGAANACHECI
jgi:hypothetical protein